MKISIIQSVLAQYDAISNIVLEQRDWLIEAGFEVNVFTHMSEVTLPDVYVLPDAESFLANEEFKSTELYIFHFGIYFDGFDAVFGIPTSKKVVGIFHNFTPENLLGNKNSEVSGNTLRQAQNFSLVDFSVCDSEYNNSILRELLPGISSRVMDLPVKLPSKVVQLKPSFRDGTVRMLFVGRLTSAKGPLLALSAVLNLASSNQQDTFEFTLMGKFAYSDSETVRELRKTAEKNQVLKNLQINIVLDADEDVKALAYEGADIFIIPSRHEGFCVPVVEALSYACQVLTFDNSNLRFIGANLPHRVPTDDEKALSKELQKIFRNTVSTDWKEDAFSAYASKAYSYCQRFDRRVIMPAFINLVQQMRFD